MFGHEVCHYLRHCGNQLKMHPLFLQLQESQANHFAYHFCVPTFMLQQLREVTIYDVMELFNVEFDFALRRLEMYRNNVLGRNMSYARTYS
ncbi:MAG TPA: ImmA/IrrE family metallo-endopeptidase [Pseudogracilibacillus sp.]|nr:ImmA/IrrE family metallo-endopeptidase [Pseudogracilibacillus sp.]